MILIFLKVMPRDYAMTLWSLSDGTILDYSAGFLKLLNYVCTLSLSPTSLPSSTELSYLSSYPPSPPLPTLVFIFSSLLTLSFADLSNRRQAVILRHLTKLHACAAPPSPCVLPAREARSQRRGNLQIDPPLFREITGRPVHIHGVLL